MHYSPVYNPNSFGRCAKNRKSQKKAQAIAFLQEMLVTFEGYQAIANRAKDDTKSAPKGPSRNFRRTEDRGAPESTFPS